MAAKFKASSKFERVPILNLPFNFWKFFFFMSGMFVSSLLLLLSTLGVFSGSHDGLSNREVGIVGLDDVNSIRDSASSLSAVEDIRGV